MKFIVAVLILVGSVVPLAALETSQGKLQVQIMAEGLSEPWGMAFLPNGNFLVTERGGRLWIVDDRGVKARVRGGLRVHDLHRDGSLERRVVPGSLDYHHPRVRKAFGEARRERAVLRVELADEQGHGDPHARRVEARHGAEAEPLEVVTESLDPLEAR